MARPHEKIHRVQQMLSCYQKDLDYFHDHKGEVPLSTYLVNAGYEYAGGHSRYEKLYKELQEAKREIQDLKKQLLFEKSKNKKQASVVEINEAGLIKFYEEKKLGEQITKPGSSINWQNLFVKNIGPLSGLGINDAKVLQKWCMDYYRNNSIKKIQEVDKHQVG